MSLIVLGEGDGGDAVLAERVPSGAAGREFVLRDLIHDWPAALPVHAIDASLGRVFTVAREFHVPSVGFIDVLLADERGRLIVVECKLWANPQARREVVGQILDYARELARWDYEDLQRQISATTKRKGNVLYEMACDAGCDLDEASFADGVARDLAAGRFLLIVAGDGITEGTQRIGEYLRDQPGLAFGFGLVEIAEYRIEDPQGHRRTIMQPRLLARTATIERHVIRSEVPGLVIETIEDASPAGPRPVSDAGNAWRHYVERFAAEVSFDDPGQPSPRSGGLGWIKVPLPSGYYINLYRSQGEQAIGAQVRFPAAEGEELFAALLAEREEIDKEFVEAGLEPPRWLGIVRSDAQAAAGLSPDADASSGGAQAARDIQQSGSRGSEDRRLLLTQTSLLPWDEAREADQRAWFALQANQLVNSLRPRLQRLADDSR